MKTAHRDIQEIGAKKPSFNLEPLVDGYGSLSSYRIRKAATKFGLEHLRSDLRIIPLEQGERIQIAGLLGLDMTYMGIAGGRSVFQRRVGGNIENPLMKASSGLRYDIFVGQYWTRALITSAFQGAEVNFDAVSRVQALEMVVYDKKSGTVEHSWLSLGSNKDKVLGPGNSPIEMRPIRVTEKELPPMPKATRKSMAPQPSPLEGTSQTLSPSEVVRLVKEAVGKHTTLVPFGEAEAIPAYVRPFVIGGKTVEASRRGGVVSISFDRNGHTVSEEVELGKITLKAHELPGGYRIHFRGYPLDNNSRGEMCDYVMVAAVFSPSAQLYSAFVIGARG